jgi:hypothetical protein
MRVFKQIRPQRAESEDGVAVFSIDRFHIRYQRPDKYCDLYREAFLSEDNTVVGMAITLSRKPRFGIDVLWHLPDGTTMPAIDSEINEIKEDLKGAIAALGSQVKFD